MAKKQLNRDAVPWEPKLRHPQPPPSMVSPAITYIYPTISIGSQYNCYYEKAEYFSYYHRYSANTTVPPTDAQYGVVLKAEKRDVVKTCRKIYGGYTKSIPPRLRSVTQSRVMRMCRFQWKPKTSNSGGGGGGSGGGAASGGGGGGCVTTPCDEGDSLACCKTSVMIKNIPNQFRRNMLIEFLDKLSEKNHLEYDFLYLPMDFVRKNSLGYAFVNFTSASAATRIRELLNGYKWGCTQTGLGSFCSHKVCEVTYARIQGKEALVRSFERTTFCCSNYEWLPVFFTPPRNGLSTTSEQKTIGKCRPTA